MTGVNVRMQHCRFVVGTVEQADDLLHRLTNFGDGVNLDLSFSTLVVANRELSNDDLRYILQTGELQT